VFTQSITLHTRYINRTYIDVAKGGQEAMVLPNF